MEPLKQQIAALPTGIASNYQYLAVQTVTNVVTAFLFPGRSPDQLSEQDNACVNQQTSQLFHELGWLGPERLDPPIVPADQVGLYWVRPARPLFDLGQLVMTPGAAALSVNFLPYLARHIRGDWGDLDDFDRRENDKAIHNGTRILSAYTVPGRAGGERIWLITEADRFVTTILLPEEY
jgi:hypothetical protein